MNTCTKNTVSALVAVWTSVASVSQATTWYVSKTGAESNAGNVSGAPFASVTNALAHAGANDLIAVSAGVYTQNVVFATGKSSITLRGGYDPTSWEWLPASNISTIRGSGGSPVSFSAAASSNTLAYVTLTSGGVSYDGVSVGGAITNLTIEGSTIISNRYGLFSNSSYLTTLVMKNTLVTRNNDIGIYIVANSGTCSLYNCTVVSNNNHGLYCNNTSTRSDNGVIVPVVKNCIFSDNKGWGLNKVGSTTGGSLQNCLFYGNASGSAAGRTLADLGGNKCGRSPKYVDPAAMNYQLSTTSPASAAGMDTSSFGVTTDLLGVSRPGANGWDMGAYQGSGSGESTLASVVYVSTSGSNATGDGTSGNPWATVSYGLGNVAVAGTVRVADGTYTDNVHFGPGNRYMTIKGGYESGTWAWSPSNNHTVITGNSATPIQLDACADTTTVSCVTLTGGGASGSGVLYNANIYGTLIDGCTITNNKYGVSGIHARSLTVQNSIIAGNTSDGFNFTAGVNLGGGVCNLYNCTVAKNGGNGYYASSGNSGWGAVNPIAKNCLFTDNTTYGINVNGSGTKSMAYSLFYNNASGATLGTITDLGGNKSGRDPKYANLATLDLHIANNSPAAAAGTNLVSLSVTNDIVGVVRPGPNGFDMGAYQGSGAGEPPQLGQAYVSTTGNNVTGTGSSANPWATISYALANVTVTGTVRVAAGTYTEAVNFAADRKGITIQGGYDPATWTLNPAAYHTTINGNGSAPVSFAAASDSNTLSCLTLTGGGASAGVLISGNLNALVIDGCTIISNTYGIAAVDITMTATVRNTIVARNTSHGFNFSTGSSQGGSCSLYNCTVANNGGSGYYVNSGNWAWGSITPIAKNTLFTDNGGYGIEHRGTGAGSIQNCLFYNNAFGPTLTQWYNTCLPDLGGNKSGRDPKYVSADALDYRVSANSPAAAAGTNLVYLGVTNDIMNATRPGTVGWDMGAYQGSGSGEGALSSLVYVRPGGSNSSGDGSSGNPWATINYALGYVAPSGAVRVAGGTYTENVQFGPDKKGISLQGGYDPTTWAWAPAVNQTVINAYGSGRAPILLTSGAESNTLSYLTVLGGTNTAGIFVNGAVVNLAIDGCQIVSNQFGLYGGAFLTTPTLRNTLIARNSSHGIYFNETYSGGSAGQSMLYNCTIVNNAGSGFMGDFSATHPDNVPVAKNCLFTDNAGYGISKGGNGNGGSIENCLFYNNASGATNSVGTTLSDLGNTLTTSDPLYVDAGNDNYQLQRLSPGVDSGVNLSSSGVTMDILGILRPLAKIFDRGAYERSRFQNLTMVIVR